MCLQSRRPAAVLSGSARHQSAARAVQPDVLCPTALRLPSLDYKDERGDDVEMLVIGDPTQPGAIINDGGPCDAPSELNPAGLAARLWVLNECDGLFADLIEILS